MTSRTSFGIRSGRAGCPAFHARSACAIAIALITLLLTNGCGGEPNVGDTPRVLRVATIPDRPPDEVERVFRPLLDYIAAETGYTFELLFPESYEQTLELLGRGQLDIVRFGGFSYTLAKQRYGAEALVTRDVDLEFRSLIVVHRDLTVDSLQSLRGTSLLFGPRYSTSGHVMPRIFLEGAGIVPEDFFSEVQYGRNHVATIRAVAAGEVDAGAVNAVILERALLEDEDLAKIIRIAWSSPRFANYVWATRAELDTRTAHLIRGAFLGLTVLDESHKSILARIGAAGYLPAQQKNYEMLMAYTQHLEPELR